MNRIEERERLQPAVNKATLIFLIAGDKVLLGMKKRGFAEGKWNGFGGKQNEGETIEETAKREIREEAEITSETLVQCAVLDCHHPKWSQRVYVYIATSWEGTPKETEEMIPQWFSADEIPYDKMWEDDAIWLPMVLNGDKVKASLDFDEAGALTKHEVTSVESFE